MFCMLLEDRARNIGSNGTTEWAFARVQDRSNISSRLVRVPVSQSSIVNAEVTYLALKCQTSNLASVSGMAEATAL